MNSSLFSDTFSETKKQGLKHITKSVLNMLESSNGITYTEILRSTSATNSNTLKRRIYDVLSVMRSINIITKTNRRYHISGRDVTTETKMKIEKKKEDVKRMEEMIKAFEFLINKNTGNHTNCEKLYLPFMIVFTDRDSQVQCETNEEKTFFKFKSDKNIQMMDDLAVIKEIQNYTGKSSGKKNTDVNDIFSFIS
ncbi:transcription factor DP [Hamiltosporidium tvaerminnensis]|uniref:Transcription factor DP n=2 Tax=Hamiltosporidium TaxID=1176354 RepID=A0A4Q9L1X6_9MICR|nr:Transcription factor dpl-1 [Hamiltosporidium tvaerminnensis]TBU00076.1 transcription factor DP [Hamiltosporidium tvaerminnensis]TBU01387.1 transcription factor DP [Hamiltosporidium magnivora]TBU09316.1 transcription factor DP [Hamiltosporidium magnivora]TBU13127.1 transcription factor DP [Hamiltosporidium tvaerminnensis]